MAEVVELHKLKLAELKQECTARGLEAKGNKADLIARLQAYLDEHEEVNEEEVLGEYGEEAFAKEETDSQKQEFTPEEVTEKKLVKINPPATVGERLQKRAERFNIAPSADSKKAARAARFGLQEPDVVSSKGTSAKVNVDVEVLKKRAERFGMNVSSVSKKIEDDEKLKKRKERFGNVTSAASSGANDTEIQDTLCQMQQSSP
ncbi:SAP domain-containing ribonucleoprotein-like isoform X2 [Sinocyclocheilus anshuiensis]|uniref:SAP domain-containing ribonucleoprotein n=1 Tax=Sinocyclocheilus anshuiensis TaxID=1608454 RepID=A0A671N540_9TELE|nr:PREDICTED: SAP domain-containing ribonucleoprotein-like isoform X2 [Sinocyclocheilus anshuiensis]XP_016351677.1 PREDICTED: SAP domain-containing ribonucleoprotein-like isoform X2 [Sinocyclocheilus anshuiensis]